MARANVCDVSGVTLLSCKVTRAIRNVHAYDQWDSIHLRPAVENLIRLVAFKTIPQSRILDSWHQWCITGHVVVTEIFGQFRPSVWPSSCSNFDLGPAPSNSAKKALKIRDYGLGVQFSFKKQRLDHEEWRYACLTNNWQNSKPESLVYTYNVKLYSSLMITHTRTAKAGYVMGVQIREV